MWASNAEVVLFPLVPVTQIVFSSGLCANHSVLGVTILHSSFNGLLHTVTVKADAR